jgi:hypothetical protein
MNRFRLSLGALAALTLSLLAAYDLANPREARAICYCSTTLYSTPTFMAKGASCEAAEAKLEEKALPYVTCGGYEVCYQSLVITTECYWDDAVGAYKVFGFIRYRCEAGTCL